MPRKPHGKTRQGKHSGDLIPAGRWGVGSDLSGAILNVDGGWLGG
ncbi:hypothetical protein [Salinibacterium sp. SWN1162]|nr:hypothetical protein [Salinibacterium sp. SWN1162]